MAHHSGAGVLWWAVPTLRLLQCGQAVNFDVVVIGSGPGGYKAAITAAHLGAKVALVEKSFAGGNCLNHGCIPKKTLLHLAALIENVNELQGRGLVGAVRGDFKAAMDHKNAVILGIRENFSVWLQRLGIRVFQGEARFAGAGNENHGFRIELLNSALGAQHSELFSPRVIIATGGEPSPLASCPTDGRHILNSQDFMGTLDRAPETLLCVGGGAIGVELGFLAHQFGSRVTIVERGERLLHHSRMPERAGSFLERKFARIGIEVRKGCAVAASRVSGDQVEITYSDGAQAVFEKVLVAVGRRPLTTGLQLENAGVELDQEGFIKTSECLETSVPGIYAVGDVKRGPMTANAALHDAKVAAGNAVQGNRVSPNYFKVPMVIHSAYEIAAVGLTEEQAEAAGFAPDVARSSLGGSGKARAHHDYEGFVEVVHDEETGQLLGGCIVGPEAGEQIHMMTAACQSTRGLWFFKDMSYSHPSWCEELETAIDPYASAFAKSDKEIFQPGILAARDW